MARYIKVNPLVADYLNLCNDRNTVKDGNYLLWQADMLRFGPLTQLTETLKQIGGLALMPHEAKEEQDGTVTRKLPTPLDKRFIMDGDVQTAEGGDVTDTPETDKAGETTGSEDGNGNGENGDSSESGTESGSEDDPDQKKEGGVNE